MINDVWFWLFIASVVLGGGFSLLRELHFRTLGQSYRQILRVIRGACKQLSELKQLCLDIEQRRKLDAIQEHLNAGTKIYNTNADGGQVNQGGSVHGDQR